jgi:hypothetical protein
VQAASAFSDPSYVCLQPPFLHDVPIAISVTLWFPTGQSPTHLMRDFTCCTKVGDTSTSSFTYNNQFQESETCSLHILIMCSVTCIGKVQMSTTSDLLIYKPEMLQLLRHITKSIISRLG